MNNKIFIIKHITSKSCFCYLSEHNSKFFDKGIILELNHDDKARFFSAQPLLSLKENEIGINRSLAQLLKLQENSSVMVSARYNLPTITKIAIVTKSRDDYKILELLSENVQNKLLDQLHVVNKDQEFIIWVTESLKVPVNVEKIEPVDLGRLHFLTEVEIELPKPKMTESPLTRHANEKWNFLDFINPFKKQESDKKIESIESKFEKRCHPVCFKLHKLTDLDNYKDLDIQHFNAFVDKFSLPKNICSGDIFRLNIIIPPVVNNNFIDESSFDIKTIVVRINVLDNCITDQCYPIMYLHQCIFKHFNIKVSSKGYLSDCIKFSPSVNTIEICANVKNSSNAIGKFKLFVNRNCKTHQLVLNAGIVIDYSGCEFSLRFLPSNVTFCIVNSDLIRNCKFTASELVCEKKDTSEVKLLKYCENFGNVNEIIDCGSILLHLPFITSIEAENILIVGKAGSGKTTLTQALVNKLSSASRYIHSEIISCKALKGKSLDSLNKIFQGKILSLRYYQPSLLILDDIHVLCEKVPVGDAPTPESLQFERVSEMLANLLDETLKCSKISIIATSTSLLKLNDHIFSSRGQHLFKNIFEIRELNKFDRCTLLEFLFKQKCETDKFSMDHLAQKTEGFVIQDLVDFVDKSVFESIKEENPLVTLHHCELALQNSTALSLKDVQLHSPGDRDFSDIGGLENVKKILVECMLWPIQYPRLFDNAPLRLQSGLLLYGPPGTGKTILAGAAAKHCGLRLISIKGPELLSKYIGASEQAVRDVFEKAQSAKPCILFFDEFDSLAPRRGHDSTGVTDRVVNQLLTQLDGVESLSGVCVLAATSRPDLLDPALLRPGRLDRQILCPLPDQAARLRILESLSKKIRFDDDVDLEIISQQSNAYSGADLQAVLYTAQLSAVENIGFSEVQGKADDVIKINQYQLEEALRSTRPSLTKEERLKYERIYSKFQNNEDLVDIKSGSQKATLA